MKDRFLAWQSAALIFAIQQADFDKLAEIQKTYESLGRNDGPSFHLSSGTGFRSSSSFGSSFSRVHFDLPSCVDQQIAGILMRWSLGSVYRRRTL